MDESIREQWLKIRRETLEAEDLVDVAEQRLLGLIQRGWMKRQSCVSPIFLHPWTELRRPENQLVFWMSLSLILQAKAEELNQWSQATALVHSYRRAAMYRLTSGDGSELRELVAVDLSEADRLIAISESAIETAEIVQIPNDFGRLDRISWVKNLVDSDQLQAFESIQKRVSDLEQSILLASLQRDLSESLQAVEVFDGTLPTEDIEQLGLNLDQIRQQRAQLEDLRGEESDEALELRIQIEQAREELASEQLEAANRAAEDVIEESATTQQELQQAQARAEEARRLAEEARGQDDSATAALREQVLQFSDMAAEILLAEVGTDEQPGRSPLARQRVAQLQEDLESAKMKASAALGMAPLEPGGPLMTPGLPFVEWSMMFEKSWTQYESREQLFPNWKRFGWACQIRMVWAVEVIRMSWSKNGMNLFQPSTRYWPSKNKMSP